MLHLSILHMFYTHQTKGFCPSRKYNNRTLSGRLVQYPGRHRAAQTFSSQLLTALGGKGYCSSLLFLHMLTLYIPHRPHDYSTLPITTAACQQAVDSCRSLQACSSPPGPLKTLLHVSKSKLVLRHTGDRTSLYDKCWR